jgi:hypothetical protein
LTQPMLDYGPERLLGYPRPSSFVTAHSRAEVERAAQEWAEGLGWRRPGSRLSFNLERFLLPSSLHVDMAIIEAEGETTVLVTALVSVAPKGSPYLGEGTPPHMAGFLEDVGASFAAGVAGRLESQDRRTLPRVLPPGLTRLLSFDQGLRRLFWPLMAAGPALLSIAVAVRGFRPYSAGIAAAVLWLAAGYTLYNFLRWRDLGAGYGWILGVSLLLWVGVLIAGGLALGG